MNSNNPLAKHLKTQYEDEYSFRFVISINQHVINAVRVFYEIKAILEVVIENIKDEEISEIMFTEASKSYDNDFKIQYAFFSKNKNCIEKYSACFKELNELLTQDALNQNIGVDTQYVDLFKKICLKNKLLDTLEVNPTTNSPKTKI